MVCVARIPLKSWEAQSGKMERTGRAREMKNNILRRGYAHVVWYIEILISSRPTPTPRFVLALYLP